MQKKSVKSLDIAFLNWLVWLNVYYLYTVLYCPFYKDVRGKLRSIIYPDSFRFSFENTTIFSRDIPLDACCLIPYIVKKTNNKKLIYRYNIIYFLGFSYYRPAEVPD